MHYQKHVFFCLNQKENDKKCCMDADSATMHAYAKARVREYPELQHIRINKSGCLGRCSLGPSVVIYPEGIWYTYRTEADIDVIIEEHLLRGNIVQRLLMVPEAD